MRHLTIRKPNDHDASRVDRKYLDHTSSAPKKETILFFWKIKFLSLYALAKQSSIGMQELDEAFTFKSNSSERSFLYNKGDQLKSKADKRYCRLAYILHLTIATIEPAGFI